MKAARRTMAAALAAVAWLAAPVAASAALVDRGGGLVYDTERNITWLAAPALLPGSISWTDAMLFAQGFEYAGGTGWLLPLTYADPGCPTLVGFGCTASLMGHLFHQRLGGQPGTSVFDATGDTPEEIAAVALMPALAEDWFWSHDVTGGGAFAWAFNFGTGEQAVFGIGSSLRVLLVHAGDLGAAQAVAAPPTLPLALAAAALALLVRPRRRPPR